jgi:hypothetical protein
MANQIGYKPFDPNVFDWVDSTELTRPSWPEIFGSTINNQKILVWHENNPKIKPKQKNRLNTKKKKNKKSKKFLNKTDQTQKNDVITTCWKIMQGSII